MLNNDPAIIEETDACLLSQVQRGEVEAFTPLVRRYLPSVRAFVALRLPVAHLVDEIAHETFVFAFRHLHECDLKLSFRSWLQAIAWNLVRAELQRFAREQVRLTRLEKIQHAESSRRLESEAVSEEALFLEECLAHLPDTMRRLIEDSYHRGASAGEIAQRMGRTQEWVRVTLFRVRKQLRSCIESKLAGSPYAA